MLIRQLRVQALEVLGEGRSKLLLAYKVEGDTTERYINIQLSVLVEVHFSPVLLEAWTTSDLFLSQQFKVQLISVLSLVDTKLLA